MDVLAIVIDFLPIKESTCQSYEMLNLSFLEYIGKNETFHKHQTFDHSPNLGIKILLAPY